MTLSDAAGPAIALTCIVVVAWALLRSAYPHAVLLLGGLAMLVAAQVLGYELPALQHPTGAAGFDLFRYIAESFAKTLSGVGLMIMAIGGFVKYMDAIGASGALVAIATKPLSWFRRYPYASSALLIPVGQLLFVCIPSAAGLGLLLMASVFPLIVSLGVSRLSAVSVIVACTTFGIGPASAITARATQILDTTAIDFFFSAQIPLVAPMSLLMALSFFFVNRYFDRRQTVDSESVAVSPETKVVIAPRYYAVFPVLPLIFLMAFSGLVGLFPVKLDTTTAMFVSLGVAATVDALRTRDLTASLASLKIFWAGMAAIFQSVVTLIVAAAIFSKGLIALGFINALLVLTETVGLGAVGVGVMMTCLIFAASMLMGSGNASFFAFGPLVPRISTGLGTDAAAFVLPMQLAASMGRTVSPIAGVVIATAQLANVSPLAIAHRNLVPLLISLLFMLVFHFGFA